MATLYWGPTAGNASGTWDLTTTTNWYTDLARTVQASAAPTAADDVVFDAASNVTTGAFTVTIGAAGAVCKNFSTGGAGGALDGTMTLTGSGAWSVYGSLTFPASNLTNTYSGIITFASTSAGNVVTTNGVTLTSSTVFFNGVNGAWSLGSALTVGNFLTVYAGSFDTSNFNVSCASISVSTSNAKSITLGSSTVTCAGATVVDFSTPTNLTFNAGTSLITAANGNIFAGGNQTFYNVTFGNGAFQFQISGANTFNNLTFATAVSATAKYVSFGANQTINGTLTLGASNTYNTRLFVCANNNAGTSNTLIVGTQRTLTCNTVATLSDVDFRDIKFAGNCISGGPLTGTRLGNCGGNDISTITFPAPKIVYWNLAGAQNWGSNGWATTNNGAPATANFPLAQDTATFTEAGAAGTITLAAYNIGSIQMADGVSNRTTAFTLATGTILPAIYGNVTFFSGLTLSGTGNLTFCGQGSTQTITSAGVTFTQPITINTPNGTFKLADNFTASNTTGVTLTSGTLDVNDKALSCYAWASNNTNTRAISFGVGQITLTGNNATVWSHANATNFTYSGTANVTLNYSGSTGTRTIVHGTTGGTEVNAMTFNVTAGTDTVAITATSAVKTLNFTGFAGTLTNTARVIYGDMTISTGMSLTAGANATTFAATSGTQQITTNNKTLDFPLIFNGINGTFAFQDALTQGSTRAFTITNGTVQLKNSVTSTVGALATSGTTQKILQSIVAGSQATLSQASGNFNAQYLTVKDIVATGGAKFNCLNNCITQGNNSGWYFAPQLGRPVPAFAF